MRVILKKFVNKVGHAGDIVEVSEGYAKNFLLKQGLAIEASAENINQNKQQKQAEARAEAEAKKQAELVKEKLKELKVQVKATIGKNGTLFGSVTSKEIAEELVALGYNIDKKKIVLNENIKTLGNFTVAIKLYPGIQASLKVEVVAE